MKVFGGGTFQRSGIPDIIGCYHGRFFALELKAEKGKPSELQLYNIKKINEAGGIALIVRSVNDVKAVIGNGKK